MEDNLIIGSGFSSYIIKSQLKKKYKIIAPKLIDSEFYKYKKNFNFIHNKFFSKKSISVTRLKYFYLKMLNYMTI